MTPEAAASIRIAVSLAAPLAKIPCAASTRAAVSTLATRLPVLLRSGSVVETTASEQDQDAELMLAPLLLVWGPAVRTVLVVSHTTARSR
jgi:hypothetical protein